MVYKMINRIKKIRASLAANMIGTVVFLLLVFDIFVSIHGYYSFTFAFKKEYSTSTYHMADTATSLINGDHLELYLSGHEMTEFERVKQALGAYCRKMSVSLIYVIKVDTSDYGRFVSVFNLVNNAVDNSEYTAWELGHKRDTTNEEYRKKYETIYKKEKPYETVYRTDPEDGSHPHITTMVPVKNSDGDVSGILCVQRPIRELNDANRPYLINISITAVLLSVLSGLFISFIIRKQFVRPIRKISEEASRFAAENTQGEPLGSISSYAEIANLARAIDKMETDMVNYMDNLTEATAEKERFGAEMSFARTIQKNAIPNTFPAFPERTDFDIYAYMTPAKEIGGDFYNFFLTDDDHLALVIGDVSGKSVPAALFMMETNMIISGRINMGGKPGEILTFVNNIICERNHADMFVTLWLGILEISTGLITAVNAGHEDAALISRNGGASLFKTKHQIAVGIFPDTVYRDFEIQLEKGDKLFLYTDGVPEATNAEDQMFTIRRMLDVLNACKDAPPEGVLDGIHRSVDKFVGDADQFDDLTMLCVELKE